MAALPLKRVLERLDSQPRDANSTIESSRARMDHLRERVAEDVSCEPFEVARVRAESILPPQTDPDRVILYFHGGGHSGLTAFVIPFVS